MTKIVSIIKLILVLFSLSSIIVFFSPVSTFKEFGSIARFLLIIVMLIRPLRDIAPKCRIFGFISKFRRELGILVGVFGLAHGIGAFMDYMIKINHSKSYFAMLIEPYVWNTDGYMFWGMLAGIVAIPLLITSNGISTLILGKHWKTLQRLAYFMFIFTGIHIAVLEKEAGPMIPVLIWIILWITAFVKNKKSKKNLSSGPKWLCVPCGYIYDENIGDPDSGIASGTRFEDIPDDWRCPVCGVGKSDFILISEEIKVFESEIVFLEYLTEDVIELKVDLKKDLEFIPGQFLNFAFKDNSGDFNRSYSIANKEGNVYTFLIKLKENGRAGTLFKTKKVGDKLGYTQISGKFKLQNTTNPKVFIATGTGLSPIYNMILNTPENISKKLYFGVANLKDMFYQENLKKIKNLEINLFLSREEAPGYNFGRMDFSKYEFDEKSEFYICGNPGVVEGAKKSLNEKGFEKVYFEEF